VKQKAGHLNPMMLTTVQIVSGIVPLLALGVAVEGNPFNIHWTSRGAPSLLYLAPMGSSLTFALLYWLYRRIPVTQTQLIPLFSTLLAVLLGAAVLDEGLSWRTAVGGLAILSGLVVAARAGARRPAIG
jgi:drug/metabolite transporter (DMT)-like permease